MKSIKKFFALTIAVIVSLGAFISTGCAEAYQTEARQTINWADAVTAYYSDDAPEAYSGMDIDTEIMRVGKTAGGGDMFSLVYVPLGVDFFADEIAEAKLFLYVAEGAPPNELRIGTLSKRWNANELTRAEAKALVDDSGLMVAAVRPEDDGWVSVSVTEIVKAWTWGDAQNFGFAMFSVADEVGGEAQGVFAAMYHGNGNAPYIKVSGRVGVRPSGYGKFGFTRVPEEGRQFDTVNANCLAYAMRDVVPVGTDDLGYTYDELNRIFFESGEDEVNEYIGVLLEKYVEENKAGFCVSSFRGIDGFDAPIDPAREYRIALRVCCNAHEGFPLVDEVNNFDFHFWAQLDDGRWTDKLPVLYSKIIPGTAPGVSPGKYYWEMGRVYGQYYTSKIIYYAVTKDADEMTVHRPSPYVDVALYDYLNNGVEYERRNNPS
ncbi:MAG: DNRLRE domain-containing protein [Firmicutes bacterium]|nr:DNRLRE domain-containing protein [Bacillota bacterium]